MNAAAKSDRPVRAGVFVELAAARRAVDELWNAGFDARHLSVISSDESVAASFPYLKHQEPGGAHAKGAALAGSAVGAAIGAALGAGMIAATGGLAVIAIGGLTLGTGGVVGGLVGAMLARGVEKEAADYYDQAVLEGRILVVAEATEEEPQASLQSAERILTENGAQPMSLREG